jgi:hypothetical protein
MRSEIRERPLLPDYELPDQDGVDRRLSELGGANPMVLHLSGRGYDPMEHVFLHHLVDVPIDFRVASPGLPLRRAGLRERGAARPRVRRRRRSPSDPVGLHLRTCFRRRSTEPGWGKKWGKNPHRLQPIST